MKRIQDFIRKALTMSPSEAKGVFIIIVAILVLLGAIFLSDYFFGKSQQTVIISSPESLDSLSVTLKPKSDYKSNYQNYDNKSYSSPNNNSPAKLFNFDPNTASVEQLASLGIPKFIAERIEKYRSKGGKFKKKEDLAKIYGLRLEDFERLEPYIQLPSSTTDSSPQEQLTDLGERKTEKGESNAPNEQPATTTFKKPEAKTISKFDLNTADTTVLKQINGIGSGYAKRIVKFRDGLGGFVNVEQVRETFGLPPETADELLKYGFVKGGFRRIKINEVADFTHPYIKRFQVKAIVAYRQQHGNFKSADDLKAIKILDEATIEKIKPYLEF
jgi:competence protein ComEA